METKQYVTKQPVDHWTNQRGNQKIPRGTQEWKHSDPKPMGCKKTVLRGKFIAIQSYLRKQEKSQINNLALHIKQLEKEQTKAKVSKRKETIRVRVETNKIERKKK